MIVDYLGHSGFLVETEKALLLFDACGTATSVLDTKDREKPLFVFVSHAHADHFDPAIFSLRGMGAQPGQGVSLLKGFSSSSP